MLRSSRPAALRRRVLVYPLVAAAIATHASAASPRWTIEHPVEKGQHWYRAATPLEKDVAEAKAREERNAVVIDSIEVEGLREREFRREPPRTAEQRFADALNEGSPELIAGRTYDGYYYDGTVFWGADPLTFAWKNLKHWFRR